MGFFESIGKVLGAVAPVASIFNPVLGAGLGALGSLGGGGGGGSNLGGIIGAVGSATGGSAFGQGQPDAPVWSMDPGAKKLMEQLTGRFQSDLNAPGGMTALDNQQLNRLRHSTFGESLGKDQQQLYEQQTMHGIEGSHPAFQANQRVLKQADDRYWDSELALRQAARDRQFDLRDMSLGLLGLGGQGASAQYDSAYNGWKNQQSNWEDQQAAYAQMAQPLYSNMGLL